MRYCEVSDIIADFKGLKVEASGTAVTIETCDAMIDQETAFINARANLRYDMSVFEDAGADTLYPAAFLILKRICIFRVSQRVRNVIEVKHESTQRSSEEKYQKNEVRTPKSDLDLIVKGELLLEGVPLRNAQGGVSSFAIDDCCSNEFDTSKQQW